MSGILPKRKSRSDPLGYAANIPTRYIRYQDPNRERFVENRDPIQCVICGQVPRKSHLLVEGRCVAQKACANRVRLY